MATKLTPKVPAEKKKYEIKAGNWDRGPGIWKEGKSILETACGDMIACCGIHEVHSFSFKTKQVEYSEELQTVFNQFISGGALDENGSPSLRYLVLNRTHGKDKANQPDWFIQCLENYPGATTLDWMKNRNTGTTDIKPYFLPIYA